MGEKKNLDIGFDGVPEESDGNRQVCIIEKVDNGFYLKYYNQSVGGYTKIVIEEKLESDSTKEFSLKEAHTKELQSKLIAMAEVFEDMMSYFGYYNSKHDLLALDISVVDREDFPVDDTLQELKLQIKQLESCDNVEPDTSEDCEESSEHYLKNEEENLTDESDFSREGKEEFETDNSLAMKYFKILLKRKKEKIAKLIQDKVSLKKDVITLQNRVKELAQELVSIKFPN